MCSLYTNVRIVPLLQGIRSGFLSSISYKSCTSDLSGIVALSLMGKACGLGAEPRVCDLTRRVPATTTEAITSNVTVAISITSSGVSSNGTGVPRK